MKHTPGPWATGKGSYRDECRVEQANSHRHPQSAELGVKIESHYVICHCAEPEAGQGRANARLIAAAPELLEACNHALFLLSGLSTDGEITMTSEGKDRIQRELKAAIAKAEGD